MANNFLLEVLIRHDKGVGNFLTASQFLFTTLSAAFLVRRNALQGEEPQSKANGKRAWILGIVPWPGVPVLVYAKMTLVRSRLVSSPAFPCFSLLVVLAVDLVFFLTEHPRENTHTHTKRNPM
jgi:hypothetical protein